MFRRPSLPQKCAYDLSSLNDFVYVLVPYVAPQDVSAVVLGNNIKVTWNAPSLPRMYGNITGYKVIYHTVTPDQGKYISCGVRIVGLLGSSLI